jgi:hypothetical protein
MGDDMKSSIKALLAATGFAALALSPANAFEAIEASTKSGAFIGASAGVPPPGIYMFNQVFTYQANFTGPGTTSLGLGNHASVHANDYTMGFLFVPGWTFLGATYDAVLVQPWVDVGIGTLPGLVPAPGTTSGAFNTYIVPVELSWKLGTSGFAVKTGLGIYAPTGTQTGANKLGNVGNPWWTFQPELIISYLANGWNLSAAIYEEFNTRNRVTHYTSGDTFHVDLTATKTFGKWTVGPVGYYVAQVTDDKCPAVTCAGPGTFNLIGTAAHTQRFHVFALGGLVEYNFGPASLSVWATQEVTAKASNTAAIATIGEDLSLATRGATVFSTLSFRLWAPEEPAKAPMIHK